MLDFTVDVATRSTPLSAENSSSSPSSRLPAQIHDWSHSYSARVPLHVPQRRSRGGESPRYRDWLLSWYARAFVARSVAMHWRTRRDKGRFRTQAEGRHVHLSTGVKVFPPPLPSCPVPRERSKNHRRRLPARTVIRREPSSRRRSEERRRGQSTRGIGE